MPLMFPREVAVFQLQMTGREAGLLAADSPEAGQAVHGSQAGPVQPDQPHSSVQCTRRSTLIRSW